MIAIENVTDWVSSEKSLTFATWALVIATIALVMDSWLKGREQQKRWDSEDERSREQTELQLTRWREEDQRRHFQESPHVAFGLQAVDHKLRIWCANVGAVAFVIESVVFHDLNHQTMEHSEVSVLPSGSLESFSLSQMKLASYYGEKVFEVRLRIKVAEKTIETKPSCFTLNIGFRGDLTAVAESTNEQVSKMCPKCEHIAVFQFNDASSLEELRGKVAEGVEQIASACPNHATPGLLWMMDPYGKKYQVSGAIAE